MPERLSGDRPGAEGFVFISWLQMRVVRIYTSLMPSRATPAPALPASAEPTPRSAGAGELRAVAGLKAGLAAAPGTTVRRLASDAVFAGAAEVLICHRGVDYRLRRTSLGKLILTK